MDEKFQKNKQNQKIQKQKKNENENERMGGVVHVKQN
jgi:hypothetical protein